MSSDHAFSTKGGEVLSNRGYMMVRLLLACTALCLSCGLFAEQASAKAPPCADLYLENVSVSPTNPVVGMPAIWPGR